MLNRTRAAVGMSDVGKFFGPNGRTTSSSSSVATLGARLAFASPSGGAVAAAPAGFNGLIGRLLVTLSADTTWASLTAGADGQLLEVKVIAGNFTLTLPQSAFHGIGDLALTLNNGALLYYDSTVPGWEVTSP